MSGLIICRPKDKNKVHNPRNELQKQEITWLGAHSYMGQLDKGLEETETIYIKGN